MLGIILDMENTEMSKWALPGTHSLVGDRSSSRSVVRAVVLGGEKDRGGQSISWERGRWVQALISHLDSYQSLPQRCQRLFLEFVNLVTSLPYLNAPTAPHWLPPRPRPRFSHSHVPLLPHRFTAWLPMFKSWPCGLSAVCSSVSLNWVNVNNLSHNVIVKIKWFDLKLWESA